MGRLCDQPLPGPVSDIASRIYARAYGVNLDEAEGGGAYRSFDDFFTRRLRIGARVVEDAKIVSPSDGKIVAAGNVADGATILVKGRGYDVAELIGSFEDARRYTDGEYVVVYLHPRDYHRVHAPVDGEVVEVRAIPGDLYPVNSIGERHVPGLFVRNQRVNIVIDTAELGRVSVVMVGATIVGRISVRAMEGPSVPVGNHLIQPVIAVCRGDEIGTFHLGSTVVMVLEKGANLSRATGPVQFGESLERA